MQCQEYYRAKQLREQEEQMLSANMGNQLTANQSRARTNNPPPPKGFANMAATQGNVMVGQGQTQLMMAGSGGIPMSQSLPQAPSKL